MSSKLDPRNFLRHAFIYKTYQNIVGGTRARKLFIKNNVKAKKNNKILDIGCGPGYVLDFLPKVDYYGSDIDQHYIDSANINYKDKGTFICAGVDDFVVPNPGTFDIVMASGVVHHLDDEKANKLFNIAYQALKPNGRFITFDGCYVKDQSKIAHWFLKSDRGEFVRTQEEYEAIAKNHFSDINSIIDEAYFRIPYTSLIMECKKL